MKNTIFFNVICSLFLLISCKKEDIVYSAIEDKNSSFALQNQVNGTVFIATRDSFNSSELVALDAKNGNVKWKYSGDFAQFEKTGCIAGGVIYLTTMYDIRAINTETGVLIWKRSFPNRISSSITAPCVSGNMVYTVSSNVLYALDISDGKNKWRKKLTTVKFSSVHSSPTVVNNVLYIGNWRKLSAFNSLTGDLKWEFIASDGIGDVSSAPYVLDNKVYFTISAGYLFGLNAENGRQVWKSYFGINNESSPTGDGINIFVTSDTSNFRMHNLKLHAFNAQTGIPINYYSAIGGIFTSGDPYYLNSTVYYSNSDSLIAFNSSTFIRKWGISRGGGASNSGPCATTDIVYITSNGGNNKKSLHALNAETGKAIWEYHLNEETYDWFSPLVVLGNGISYHPTISGMTQ